MYTLLQVYFPTVETSGVEIGRESTFKLTFVLPTSAGATVNCMVINCAKTTVENGYKIIIIRSSQPAVFVASKTLYETHALPLH